MTEGWYFCKAGAWCVSLYISSDPFAQVSYIMTGIKSSVGKQVYSFITNGSDFFSCDQFWRALVFPWLTSVKSALSHVNIPGCISTSNIQFDALCLFLEWKERLSVLHCGVQFCALKERLCSNRSVFSLWWSWETKGPSLSCILWSAVLTGYTRWSIKAKPW